MPDDLMPETPTAESQTTEATDTSPLDDDAYDSELSGLIGNDDAEGATQAAETGDETQTDETPSQTPAAKSVLTLAGQKALESVGIDAELVTGWPQEKLNNFIDKIRATQDSAQRWAEVSERQEQAQLQKAAEQAKQNRQPSEFRQQVDEIFSKLAESYDEDIKPLAGLFSSMDERIAEMSESAGIVPQIGALLTELVLSNELRSLEAQYPTLSKADAREKVTERFWTEWKTGEYQKLQKPIIEQIREAITNSTRVTFNNIDEKTAVANLVNKNKKLVQSQPKLSSGRQNPNRTGSEDDIYDSAFEETIGKELSRA